MRAGSTMRATEGLILKKKFFGPVKCFEDGAEADE